MFLFLHRLMKAAVVALWLGAAFLVWQQREHGRPLLDYYQAWKGSGYRLPEPLPQLTGTVTRVATDTAVFVRDDRGVIWSFGMAGVSGVPANTPALEARRFAAETRTNLLDRLAGQRVTMAIVVTNANRTGLGFLYVGTNSLFLAQELVAEGRWRLEDNGVHLLPLKEQVRLRAAERLARKERRGLWSEAELEL